MRAWKQINRGSLSCFGKLLARPFEHQSEHRAAVKSVRVTERKFVHVKPEIFPANAVVRPIKGPLHLRFRRAMTPSCATASGSVLPCSQSQRVRAGTSNSAAASACVRPSRARSDVIKSAKVMLSCGDHAPSGREMLPRLQPQKVCDKICRVAARALVGLLHGFVSTFFTPGVALTVHFRRGGGLSVFFCRLPTICCCVIFHASKFRRLCEQVNIYFAESANCSKPLITNENL
jgi:hypothetical protein